MLSACRGTGSAAATSPHVSINGKGGNIPFPYYSTQVVFRSLSLSLLYWSCVKDVGFPVVLLSRT